VGQSPAKAAVAEVQLRQGPPSADGAESPVPLALPSGAGSVRLSAQHGITPLAYEVPALSADELKFLREEDATQGKGGLRVSALRIFEAPFVKSRSISPMANWTTLDDGTQIAALSVRVESTLGFRLHLENIALPEGVTLLVYDPANPLAESSPVTSTSLHGETEVWADTTFGDTAVLECTVPAGVTVEDVGFEVTGLTEIYKAFWETDNKEGTCHNDVMCYPDWANERDSVARMFFVDGGLGYACTGALLNDLNSQNWLDYFLTANHCINNQTVASTLECYWFFQAASCGGAVPNIGSVPRTTGGATYLAGVSRTSGSDFTLLHLRNPPPGGVYYSGWDTASPGLFDTLTGIHHPDGAYKRISFCNLLSWGHLGTSGM
jgi:hypothetical protein